MPGLTITSPSNTLASHTAPLVFPWPPNESNAKIVEGVANLYDLMEGRNNDYTLKDTSILDILRSNINVDVAHNLRTDLGSLTRVDYGVTDREPGIWTVEARVDFVCNFLQTL